MNELNICTVCGNILRKVSEKNYACECCNTTYPIEKIENYTDKMTKLFDDMKLESIKNARKNLYNAISAEFISSDSVHECCAEVKKYLPDDFQANFYDAAVNTTPRNLARLIRKIDVEEQFECLETVINFLISSLNEIFAADTEELIRRTFEKRDISKFNKYLTMLSAEMQKINNCVYLTNYSRDVFVAGSHKDMNKILELVEVLEDQGLKCFLWTRNLQHGAGSHERYRESLQEAIDNCKCFVFVSSMNSRHISCDAFKEEIPYVKQKDVDNAPSEERNYYSRISKSVKKPRVEYFLEVSAKENAADESVKEFFDGYERAYVPMEVAKKVIKQLSEVAVESVPQVIEKKVKFCVSCLTECDENATKCHFCKETTFADDIMKAAEIKRKVDKLKEKQEKEAEIERANLEAQIREREEKERIEREKERLEREAREKEKQEELERLQRETVKRMQEAIEKLQRSEEKRRQEEAERLRLEEEKEEKRRQEEAERLRLEKEKEEKRRQEEDARARLEEEKRRQAEAEKAKIDPDEQYQLGEKYSQNKNFVDALNCYLAAAQAGHDMAQYKLGLLYAKGDGTKKDLCEAVKWFGLSADQGNANAQYNLGVCYEYGYGVKQDCAEAIRLYELSANQENVNAQYNLGFCYESGKGVQQDYKEALKWYRKAARGGLAKAQNTLGVCYYYGKGAEENQAEAVRWYRRAAEQGYALAQYNLGHCYEYSRGVTQNYDEARKWYKAAADQGYDKAKEAYERLK